MSERLAVLSQYLLPKKLLTVAAGHLASAHAGGLTHAVIRRFVARYNVDMSEAADPRIESYASFNDFVTRALRFVARGAASPARCLHCAAWTRPVDGLATRKGRT